MTTNQELFEQKSRATAEQAERVAGLSDDTLAHILAVDLLRDLPEHYFEIDEKEIAGAEKVLCALMEGCVTTAVIDEDDVTSAVVRETTAREVLTRIHRATTETLGVTMPSYGVGE